MVLNPIMRIIRKWDSSKNRASYAPTLTFFNFGIVCAIARYMPRKLFLYQLLIMRMSSKINALVRMIMRIVIKSSRNKENTIFFIAHAIATPPVPRYIHVQLHRLGILGVNHKGK